MRYALFVAALLISINTFAQTEWLKTIEGNRVAMGSHGAFTKAKPGYALYFSKSGQIDEPYLVYVPKSYDASKPSKLIVFLHGAILAREEFQYKDPEIANEPIFSIAEPYNTLVLFPFARIDFRWSGQSPIYENIMNVIEQVEDRYNVDRKHVYIGGISMGGIATYWFVNHHPEMFAGFYTFSAMPRLAGEDVHFRNITEQRPLYSMNAKDDPGFLFNEVHGLYEQHKAEAKGWHFESVETGGHRFIYAPQGGHYVGELLGRLLQ
jgi:predicted peptidase